MSSAKDGTGVVVVRPATRGDMKYVLDMIQVSHDHRNVTTWRDQWSSFNQPARLLV